MLFRNMSSSETPGNFSAASTQYFTENAGLQLEVKVSAFPLSSHSDSGEGELFRGFTTVRLRYDLLLCLPSLSEQTGFTPSPRGLLLPGFQWFGHPLHRRISLQRQLGNLRWRDFHPLDHQLASLHDFEILSAPLVNSSRPFKGPKWAILPESGFSHTLQHRPLLPRPGSSWRHFHCELSASPPSAARLVL
jgi:hypothetical protein